MRVRCALGMSPFAFAAVLGVHVSTIYRWEQTSTKLAIDPLQLAILEGLRAYEATHPSKPLGVKITRALVSAGTLAGLRVVLEAITASP